MPYGRDREDPGRDESLPSAADPVMVMTEDRAAQGLEFYYNIHLAQSVDLSLDLQWSESAFAQVDDAVILGARLTCAFERPTGIVGGRAHVPSPRVYSIHRSRCTPAARQADRA
jgi:hypothetical protein